MGISNFSDQSSSSSLLQALMEGEIPAMFHIQGLGASNLNVRIGEGDLEVLEYPVEDIIGSDISPSKAIPELANQLLNVHFSTLDQKQFVVLASDIGGTILKQLIISGLESAEKEHQNNVKRITTLVFYGTPHQETTENPWELTILELIWQLTNVPRSATWLPGYISELALYHRQLQKDFDRVCNKFRIIQYGNFGLPESIVSLGASMEDIVHEHASFESYFRIYSKTHDAYLTALLHEASIVADRTYGTFIRTLVPLARGAFNIGSKQSILHHTAENISSHKPLEDWLQSGTFTASRNITIVLPSSIANVQFVDSFLTQMTCLRNGPFQRYCVIHMPLDDFVRGTCTTVSLLASILYQILHKDPNRWAKASHMFNDPRFMTHLHTVEGELKNLQEPLLWQILKAILSGYSGTAILCIFSYLGDREFAVDTPEHTGAVTPKSGRAISVVFRFISKMIEITSFLDSDTKCLVLHPESTDLQFVEDVDSPTIDFCKQKSYAGLDHDFDDLVNSVVVKSPGLRGESEAFRSITKSIREPLRVYRFVKLVEAHVVHSLTFGVQDGMLHLEIPDTLKPQLRAALPLLRYAVEPLSRSQLLNALSVTHNLWGQSALWSLGTALNDILSRHLEPLTYDNGQQIRLLQPLMEKNLEFQNPHLTIATVCARVLVNLYIEEQDILKEGKDGDQEKYKEASSSTKLNDESKEHNIEMHCSPWPEPSPTFADYAIQHWPYHYTQAAVGGTKEDALSGDNVILTSSSTFQWWLRKWSGLQLPQSLERCSSDVQSTVHHLPSTVMKTAQIPLHTALAAIQEAQLTLDIVEGNQDVAVCWGIARLASIQAAQIFWVDQVHRDSRDAELLSRCVSRNPTLCFLLLEAVDPGFVPTNISRLLARDLRGGGVSVLKHLDTHPELGLKVRLPLEESSEISTLAVSVIASSLVENKIIPVRALVRPQAETYNTFRAISPDIVAARPASASSPANNLFSGNEGDNAAVEDSTPSANSPATLQSRLSCGNLPAGFHSQLACHLHSRDLKSLRLVCREFNQTFAEVLDGRSKATLLHIVTATGNVKGVESLLSARVEVDMVDPEGATAISIASRYGFKRIVELLLRPSSDPHYPDQDGRTPLHYASRNGYLKIATLLFQKGADPFVKDHKGETPIEAAVESNSVPLLKLFLGIPDTVDGLLKDPFGPKRSEQDFGPPIYVRDISSWSGKALLKAITKGFAEMSILLMIGGAKLDGLDSEDNTTLHWAARNSMGGVLKVILQQGASVIDAQNDEGRTPLHEAAISGDPDCVSALLDKGADPTIIDNRGKTPLDRAVKSTQIAAVRAFLQKKPAQNALNEALQWGIPEGHTAIINLLLDAGADPNYIDEDGNTALFLAIYYRNIHLLELLLMRRVDLELKDHAGRTALSDAARLGNTEIIALLFNAGADINVEDADGKTPFETALENDHPEIAAWLISHGGGPEHCEEDFLRTMIQKSNWGALKYILRNRRSESTLAPATLSSALVKVLKSGVDDGSIVSMLVDHGADPNYPKTYLGSPLQLAAFRCMPNAAEALLTNKTTKADVNLIRPPFETALNASITGPQPPESQIEMMKLLRVHKADPKVGALYRNFLNYAVARGTPNSKVLEVVLSICKEEGLTPGVQDVEGRYTAHFAATGNIVRVFEDIVLPYLKPDKQGRTPVHFAAASGSLAALDFIESHVENRSLLEEEDADGWNALHWSCRQGDSDVVRWILSTDVNLDCKTKDGLRARDIAIYHGNSHFVYILGDDAARDKDIAHVQSWPEHPSQYCDSCHCLIYGKWYRCQDEGCDFDLCFKCYPHVHGRGMYGDRHNIKEVVEKAAAGPDTWAVGAVELEG